MRAFQRFTAAAAALLLCLGLTPPARAEEDPSWDEVNAKVLAEYEMDESSIHAGYLNLVTGEEHYINGDDYALAASMYKVPLCMYFAEHLADGSLDWSPYEEYFSYKDVQDAVLIDSSNENAMFLFNTFLDGYDNFRVLTAPYMGVEPGSESVEITMHNYYTAREFIHCLKLLYDEQERFPDIIPTMQQAMTDRFFKLNEPRFRIAQKPGWMSPPDSYIPILNDCAICFTTQPIALVMFTASFNTSEEFLTAWCTAMCEYAETLANKPAPTPEPTPTPAPVVTPEPQPTPEPAPARVELPMFVPLAAVGLFLLAGLILLIREERRKRRYQALNWTLRTREDIQEIFQLLSKKDYVRYPYESIRTFFDRVWWDDLGVDPQMAREARQVFEDAVFGEMALTEEDWQKSQKLIASLKKKKKRR